MNGSLFEDHHQQQQLITSTASFKSPSLVLLLLRLSQLWKLCVLASTSPCLHDATPSFPSTPHPPPRPHYWLISRTGGTRTSPADYCSCCWRAALQRRWRRVSRVSAAAPLWLQLQFQTQFVSVALLLKKKSLFLKTQVMFLWTSPKN